MYAQEGTRLVTNKKGDLSMRKWKKFIVLTSIVALLLCGASVPASAAYELPADTAEQMTARAAMSVYMEASAPAADGIAGKDSVLFEKAADTPLDPAATMRVMVGLYAKKLIDDKKLNLDTTTGVYTEVLRDNYIWGTGLTLANMETGEMWTLKDLLSLSMIQTAADAAVTLAATTAGSVDAFVLGMNEYVKSIGCANTTLVNVTGLDDPRQKTTAHDLYIALRYALDDPVLEEALSLSEYTVTPTKNGEPRSFENSNYMLRESSEYYYEPMAAGKTGVSDIDGKALISLCVVDSYRYITVVLGCPEEDSEGDPGTHYNSTSALVRWALNHFAYQTLVKKNQPMTRADVALSWKVDSVTLVAEDTLTGVVPEELDLDTVRSEITLDKEHFEAPIEKGQVLGHATLYIREDQAIGTVNLVASESVKRSLLLFVWSRFCAVMTSPWLWGLLIVLIVLIAAYIGLAIAHNREKKRNARNRQKRRYKPMK